MAVFFIDTNGGIYRADVETGQTTRLADYGYQWTDIAVTPDGRVFATTFTGLYELNLETGTSVFRSSLSGNINALASDSRGNLYIGGLSNSEINVISSQDFRTLRTIDLPAGNFSAGDIHINGSNLYFATTGRDLLTVNLNNNMVANDFYHGIPSLYGLHSENGNLYGFAGNDIYLINPRTSSVEWVMELPINVTINGSATLAGVRVNGTMRDDVLYADANGSSLFGLGGNDILVGSRVSDQLFGGAGNDVLRGGAGNDVVVGGFGNDVLDGGAGRDLLVAGYGADIARGGLGVDMLAFQTTANVAVDLNVSRVQTFQGGSISVTGVESLRGGTGHDRLSGNWLANVLEGGAGNDTLMGRNGNDVLRGEAGNDALFGGFGNDVLNGGTGNDVLNGGGGGDFLVGGGGADRFVFRLGDGQDRIADFTQGQDRIVFQAGPDDTSDLRIIDQGRDTVIEYGANSITLVNVDHRLIDGTDFIFA